MSIIYQLQGTVQQDHNRETLIYEITRGSLMPESLGFGVMVFNATFNNISVISWRSILLMEETSVPGENHRTASH